MTFLEQELRRLFDHDALFADTRFVGNSCYGRLTENIRVKIHFATCGCAEHYEALKVTLLSREEGEIDSVLLRFQDLWGMKKVANQTAGTVFRRICGRIMVRLNGMPITRSRLITSSYPTRSKPMWKCFKNRFRISK